MAKVKAKTKHKKDKGTIMVTEDMWDFKYEEWCYNFETMIEVDEDTGKCWDLRWNSDHLEYRGDNGWLDCGGGFSHKLNKAYLNWLVSKAIEEEVL